jgi:hypothetical protein
MSATIIDLETDNEPSSIPEDTEVQSPTQVAESLSGKEQEPQEPQETFDDLPEKYRGKGIKDIVAMHQQAESLIGKHSQEVGELRQFVDGYIKGQLQTNKVAAPEPQESEVDFFEDPEAAVSRAVSKHPAIKEAQEQAHQYKSQTAIMELRQKHPDIAAVLQDPNFSTWVKGSKIRSELFQRADAAYDTDAADELISNYKERMNIVQKTVVAEKASREDQVKAASTGGNQSSAAPQSSSGKIYRRADLIKLMQTDPTRYEALSGEILQAYAERRVK